jgi:hypothetical protein
VGLTAISPLLAEPGVHTVGPFPSEIQFFITFTGGVGAHAHQPNAARQLMDTAHAPEIMPLIRSKAWSRADWRLVAPKIDLLHLLTAAIGRPCGGGAAPCLHWRRSGRSGDPVSTAAPRPFQEAGLNGYDGSF